MKKIILAVLTSIAVAMIYLSIAVFIFSDTEPITTLIGGAISFYSGRAVYRHLKKQENHSKDSEI